MHSDIPNRSDVLMGIKEVADMMGVMTESLRAWERRYGFPNPSRNASGERQYSEAHIARLRLIKGLLDRGYRPGRIIRLEMDDLISLSNKVGAGAPPVPQDKQELLQLCVAAIKAHNGANLRSMLNGQLMSNGLRDFVIYTSAPLTSLVQTGWIANQFTVSETYLLTAALEPLMRNAITSAAAESGHLTGPKVVLAAPPQDRSLLGLLFAQALFTLEGAQCQALGAINLTDLVARSRVDDVDLAVMCCSQRISPRAVIENTKRLQQELGRKILVSTSHSDAASVRRRIGDDGTLDLTGIGATVARWREESATWPDGAYGT